MSQTPAACSADPAMSASTAAQPLTNIFDRGAAGQERTGRPAGGVAGATAAGADRGVDRPARDLPVPRLDHDRVDEDRPVRAVERAGLPRGDAAARTWPCPGRSRRERPGRSDGPSRASTRPGRAVPPRREQAFDHPGELGDLPVYPVNAGEHRGQQGGVPGGEELRALQRGTQFADLAAGATAGELGQHLQVAQNRDQLVHDVAAGHCVQAGHYARDLDGRRFEQLLGPAASPWPARRSGRGGSGCAARITPNSGVATKHAVTAPRSKHAASHRESLLSRLGRPGRFLTCRGRRARTQSLRPPAGRRPASLSPRSLPAPRRAPARLAASPPAPEPPASWWLAGESAVFVELLRRHTAIWFMRTWPGGAAVRTPMIC